MGVIKLLWYALIIVVIAYIIYFAGWFLFAFGTDIYDDATDSEAGSELFWNTYYGEENNN